MFYLAELLFRIVYCKSLETVWNKHWLRQYQFLGINNLQSRNIIVLWIQCNWKQYLEQFIIAMIHCEKGKPIKQRQGKYVIIQ